MAKSRKTREEKIATTQKHHQQKQEHQMTYSLSGISLTPAVPKPKIILSTLINHHTKDLQKTFFISLFLITAEILLYFLLHQHILKMPFASY